MGYGFIQECLEMDKLDLKAYSPFNEKHLDIKLPEDYSTRVICKAVITEKIGALWVLSASNLESTDLNSFYLKTKALNLSLSKGILYDRETLIPDIDHLSDLFMSYRVVAAEPNQLVMQACRNQTSVLDSFSRDFLLSGFAQILTERYAGLIDDDNELKRLHKRFSALALKHNDEGDRFNHLNETSFVMAQIFLTIREKCLQARLKARAAINKFTYVA